MSTPDEGSFDRRVGLFWLAALCGCLACLYGIYRLVRYSLPDFVAGIIDFGYWLSHLDKKAPIPLDGSLLHTAGVGVAILFAITGCLIGYLFVVGLSRPQRAF